MENSCKYCNSKFLIKKGLINFCSIICKAKYSSTINENKNESIKFFSSLVKDSYSKIWIKNCKKCLNLYISYSKEKRCCFKCNIQTSGYCYIYVGKCRGLNCSNLATRKNSYKKIYCKNCAIMPYKTNLLKKEIQKKARIKKINLEYLNVLNKLFKKNVLIAKISCF